MVITALEADDTSAWQTRLQVAEDPESGGLGLEAPSEAELEHVLRVSTMIPSILSPRDLMTIHADYTQELDGMNLPCSRWVFLVKVEGSRPPHSARARWLPKTSSWVRI